MKKCCLKEIKKKIVEEVLPKYIYTVETYVNERAVKRESYKTLFCCKNLDSAKRNLMEYADKLQESYEKFDKKIVLREIQDSALDLWVFMEIFYKDIPNDPCITLWIRTHEINVYK